MTALFVTINDIKKFTSLNGNIDDDKLLHFVKIAQDIHICNYLGTRLYKRFQNDIINNTLVSPYTTLLSDYIKPMLIHFAMVEILPFIAYNISNKGVTKLKGENSDTVSSEELKILIEKEQQIATNYVKKFIDYMNAHLSSFPEYLVANIGEQYPITTAQTGGWYL